MIKTIAIVLLSLGMVLGCSDDSSSDGKKSKPTQNNPPSNPQKPGAGNPGGNIGKATASCGIDDVCIDWTNWVDTSVSQIEKDCKDQGGTYAASTCPASGRVARCVSTQREGAAYTTHYYDSSLDLNGLKMACDMQKGKFIAN